MPQVPPEIAGTICGTVGDTVYGHNQFGPWTRPLNTPFDPMTGKQSDVRGVFTLAALRWKTILTPEHRRSWDEYAANVPARTRCGRTTQLTGRHQYMRAVIPRLLEGIVPNIDHAPTIFDYPAFTPPVILFARASLQSVRVSINTTDDWAQGSAPLGGHLLIYASPPTTQAINFYIGPYRFLGRINGVPGVPAPEINTLFWSATGFAQFFPGDKLHFRTRVTSRDGRYSNATRTSKIAI
jgi:hypothetical protein